MGRLGYRFGARPKPATLCQSRAETRTSGKPSPDDDDQYFRTPIMSVQLSAA